VSGPGSAHPDHALQPRNDRHGILSSGMATVHPSTRSGSVASSDSQVETNLDQQSPGAFVDRCSSCMLSDPPSALPTPSTCSTCVALSPLSRLMPRDENKKSSTGAIPGSSKQHGPLRVTWGVRALGAAIVCQHRHKRATRSAGSKKSGLGLAPRTTPCH
jgi:hypothetical protein